MRHFRHETALGFFSEFGIEPELIASIIIRKHVLYILGVFHQCSPHIIQTHTHTC